MSSTIYDRSRSSTSASSTSTTTGAPNTVVKRSSSKTRSQRASHGGVASQISATRPPGAFERPQNQANGMSAGSSPPAGSARETFLNYFFGQNGPGPIAGSSVERAHGHGHGGHHNSASSAEMAQIVPVGRDMSGAESTMASGLMAGKRGIDGNNAAYDMKSLGRHIEAVSGAFHVRFFLSRNATSGEQVSPPPPARIFLSSFYTRLIPPFCSRFRPTARRCPCARRWRRSSSDR